MTPWAALAVRAAAAIPELVESKMVLLSQGMSWSGCWCRF
jgi:hypothetical protein